MRFGWLNLVRSDILTCFSSSCSALRLNCSLGLDKASPDCWFTASILAPHPVTEVLEVEAEQCAAARSIMGPCLPAWSSWDPDSPHAIPKTHMHGRPPSLSHIHKASTSSPVPAQPETRCCLAATVNHLTVDNLTRN